MSQDPASDRIAELEEDNRRLRRLLDARDAGGELRHRTRNTLALLRTIIRSSASGSRELDAYVAHLTDRLDSIGRTQAVADTHGSVDLHTLLADELFAYRLSEGDRLSLQGPTVRLQPRAGQILGLAIHELAVNAVEHGAAGFDGCVDVEWKHVSREAGPALLLTWSEQGPEQPPSPPGEGGFGTEILTRMLAYELQAETGLEYSRNGVRCDILFPLSEIVGYLVDETETDRP